jgi:hypothetical protein
LTSRIASTILAGCRMKTMKRPVRRIRRSA